MQRNYHNNVQKFIDKETNISSFICKGGYMFCVKEINLSLEDVSYPYMKVTHDRNIVRAIVYDEGKYCFAHISRNDQFGNLSYIETSGGGVEENEKLEAAVMRELKEELGVEVEILAYLGFVSDYYNLIYRHNLNHFYLVKVLSTGEQHLTNDEINDFHLKPIKLTYEEALAEYEKARKDKLGLLIYNREVPMLKYAKKIVDDFKI